MSAITDIAFPDLNSYISPFLSEAVAIRPVANTICSIGSGLFEGRIWLVEASLSDPAAALHMELSL